MRVKTACLARDVSKGAEGEWNLLGADPPVVRVDSFPAPLRLGVLIHLIIGKLDRGLVHAMTIAVREDYRLIWKHKAGYRSNSALRERMSGGSKFR